MGELIQFVPKPDPDRESRQIKRMQEEARKIYQEIFPDTAPSEYVAPDQDPA